MENVRLATFLASTMSDFVTYPLDESYFSSFNADVWNSSLPLADILAMFSGSGSGNGGSQSAPTPWRPSKPFPSQRLAMRTFTIDHATSDICLLFSGTSQPLSKLSITASLGFLWWRKYACWSMKVYFLTVPLLHYQSCDLGRLPRKRSLRLLRAPHVSICYVNTSRQKLTPFLPPDNLSATTVRRKRT